MIALTQPYKSIEITAQKRVNEDKYDLLSERFDICSRKLQSALLMVYERNIMEYNRVWEG